MSRLRLVRVLPLAVAALLCAWLLLGEWWGTGGAELVRPQAPAGAEGTPLPAIESELREAARLRGLPGIRTASRGTGRLVGRVEVHVVAPEGPAAPRPLPGVAVQVLGASEERSFGPVQVVTDGEGAFALDEVPAGLGYALIVRHAPYHEVVLRGLAVAQDRTTDVGTILLGAPTSLRGEIVDALGRPVPDARVQVLLDRSRPERIDLQRGLQDLQSAAAPLAEARSRGDGGFQLEDLPPGRYVLRVEAAGFATVFREDVWVTYDQRAPVLRVTLDPGTGYFGVVRDATGLGLGGARVIAVAAQAGRVERLDRVETTAAPDGSYRLDRLVPDVRYFLEAWAPGHAPTGRLATPRGLGRLDFELGETGRVEGRITDVDTGQGVAEAEVTLVAGLVNSLSPLSTLTDADGLYAFEAVNPGPILLFAVRAPGYPTVSFDLGAGRVVLAGDVTILDQAIEAGAAVTGRVVDDAGQPVPYATVALVEPRRRWQGERTALTDTDGRYRVTGLRASRWEMRVSAPGFAPLAAEEATFEVAEGEAEIVRDVVLRRGATLVGVVTTPEGGPAGAARVLLHAKGPRVVRDAVRDLVAVTDATGRWRIPGVPVDVELHVEADHDAWVRAESSAFRLSPGAERRVDLVLGAGVTLVGRVEDPRGAPIEGARVRWGLVTPANERRLDDAFAADEHLGPRVVRSDAAGAFRIDRLERGRILVKVQRAGYADFYRKDVLIPEEGAPPELEVVLEPAATIRGRVVDAETGRPIADAWVYAEERTPTTEAEADAGRVRALVTTQTDAQGRYELEGVPPGRHDVVVWLALGYRASAQDWRDERVRRRDVAAGAQGVDFGLERMPIGEGDGGG